MTDTEKGFEEAPFKAPVLLTLTSKKPVKSNVLDQDIPSKTSAIKQAADVSPDKDTELPRNDKLSETKPATKDDLKYSEPIWSGVPPEGYSFEVIKNGTVVDNFQLENKPYFVVGRVENVDIQLEHPTISRFHAVIQYRSEASDSDRQGFYLMDLNSTHGTVLNKQKLTPRVFCRLHVGHVIKFAGSTRLFILQGPESDMEEESTLTVTQLRARQLKQKEILEGKLRKLEEKEQQDELPTEAKKEKAEEDTGISWGFKEDAVEEEEEEAGGSDSDEGKDFGESLDMLKELQEREQYYLADPKKALRHFFDRQGLEMEFEFTEKGSSFNHQWSCKIELPVDSTDGKPVFAEAMVSGAKRDAVAQCSLEACRILDAHNVLRANKGVGKKRKSAKWEENDYYDSDEDEFLDRTGELSKKRDARMQRTGKAERKVDTFDSLNDKLAAIVTEISSIENELQHIDLELSRHAVSTSPTHESNMDSLDNFMTTLKDDSDKVTITDAQSVAEAKVKVKKLRLKHSELSKEADRLKRLINIVKPVALPELKTSAFKGKLPIVGSMKGGMKFKRLSAAQIQTQIKPPPRVVLDQSYKVVETEEDDKDPEEQDSVRASNGSVATIFSSKKSTENVSSVNKQQPTSGNTSSNEGPKIAEGKDEEKEPCTEVQRPANDPQPGVTKTYCVQVPPEILKRLSQDDEDNSSTTSEQNTVQQSKKKLKQSLQWAKGYDTKDPNFAVWLPPEDQQGDGKTKLNEKFGY